MANNNLSRAYLNHYLMQRGGDFPIFKGSRHQYGSGLGAILRAAGRFLIPIAARTVSKFARSAGEGIDKGSSIGDATREALLPALGAAMSASDDQIFRPKIKRSSKTRVGVYKKVNGKKRKVGQYKKISSQKGRGIRVYKGRGMRVYKGGRKTKRKTRRKKAKKIRHLKTNF